MIREVVVGNGYMTVSLCMTFTTDPTKFNKEMGYAHVSDTLWHLLLCITTTSCWMCYTVVDKKTKHVINYNKPTQESLLCRAHYNYNI